MAGRCLLQLEAESFDLRPLAMRATGYCALLSFDVLIFIDLLMAALTVVAPAGGVACCMFASFFPIGLAFCARLKV